MLPSGKWAAETAALHGSSMKGKFCDIPLARGEKDFVIMHCDHDARDYLQEIGLVLERA